MPRESMIRVTRDALENSNSVGGRTWRLLRSRGGLTAREIAVEIGVSVASVQQSTKKLRSLGWLTTGLANDGKSLRYTHSDEGQEEKRRGFIDQIEESKAKLTAIAQKAENARRSGLAIAMGRALAEIEKEAREVRDSLFARSLG